MSQLCLSASTLLTRFELTPFLLDAEREKAPSSSTCSLRRISQQIHTLTASQVEHLAYAERLDLETDQWVPIPLSTIRTLWELQIPHKYISAYLGKGYSLSRVLGLASSLYPNTRGELLAKKIGELLRKSGLRRIKNGGFTDSSVFKWLSGKGEPRCLIRDPAAPYAWVVTAEEDHNCVFSPFNHRTLLSLETLHSVYNLCYSTIRNIKDLCSVWASAAKEKMAAKITIIQAHGEPNSALLSVDNHFKESTISTLDESLRPCLQALAPQSTLILHSCSTGKGQESAYNLANHLANQAPPGTRIFAPDGDPSELEISEVYPHLEVEARFFEDTRQTRNITYFIDSSNRKKHCPSDKISFLSLCQNQPLFREIGRNNKTQLQFYISSEQRWVDVGKEFSFFKEKGFSNEELVRISQAGVDLKLFKKRIHPIWLESGLSPSEITDRVLDSSVLYELNLKYTETV